MKSIKLIMSVLMAVSLLALSAAEIDGIYVWKSGNYTRFNLNDISFSDNKICIDEATMSVDAIDSITFTKPTEAYVVTDTILIYYRGAVASVSPQNVEGLTTEVNGAAVHITNTNADHEMTFVLSGKSNEGSFTYYGDYKASIRLAGVSLESSTGAALDIKCGKRIALELADGTDNCLKDASEDLGQKAALYCKGHMEVSGGGSLTVNGKVSHAISTKEYMLVKKGTGTIHVIAAEGDGIHVGQYFQMNGGTISVNISGRDAAAIKSDSLMSITDGKLSITTIGDADKGLKSKDDIIISGGETNIIQNSGCIVKDNEQSNGSGNNDDSGDEGQESTYRICFALSTTKGQFWQDVVYLYSSDGTKIAQMTDVITMLSKQQSSCTFFYYDFDTPPSGQFYFASDDLRVGNQTYSIRTPEVSGPTESTPVVYYQINSESFSSVGNIRTFAITDYTSRYADGTILDSGNIYTAESYATAAAIKSDKNIAIEGGTITIKTTGAAARGISCDNVFTTTGGIVDITNNGSGLGFSRNTETAKGITSDGNICLQGGTINIQMTGSGGKGIKCDGNLTIGISDDEGPVLNVSTTGTRHANSSSAKAIKVDGAITVNGGESIIQTSTLFAEGLESKLKSDASIVFNGGRHYFRCNNDCISTVGAIKFDGGIVVCYSSGDDAVDSNYGRKGAIQIGNGIVLAYSSYNWNGGFDSDNSSFIQITGNGIAIGGGANSFGNNPEASIIENAAQGYCFTASPLSYTQNRYYTLADEDGNNLVTYSVEANFTSALSFFTATGMKSGSSYTVWESQAKPTDATTEWHSIYLGSNTTGTNIVTSFTAK